MHKASLGPHTWYHNTTQGRGETPLDDQNPLDFLREGQDGFLGGSTAGESALFSFLSNYLALMGHIHTRTILFG